MSVITEFTNRVSDSKPVRECKNWEIKKLPTELCVFDRRSMVSGPDGLHVDYAEAIGKTSVFRHYYSYDKATGCEVLAVYKGKAYEVKTFVCAYTEQPCVIVG